MSETFQFYYAQETISLASHIALLDAGADFTPHRLSIASKEHASGAYLKVNSKGRVPALVTPSGILTETPAILAFIAQKFPEASLAPVDDVFGFAKLQEFNSYIVSTLHVAHAHRMRGHRWVDDENAKVAMQKKVPETVAAGFSFIQENYLDGPFVFGDTYSVADPYLFTVAQWMETDGVDPADFPKILAHRQMMLTRSSVQKALKQQFE